MRLRSLRHSAPHTFWELPADGEATTVARHTEHRIFTTMPRSMTSLERDVGGSRMDHDRAASYPR
jgi:hypothetical protein